MTSSYSKHTWCKDILFIKSTHTILTSCKGWQNITNTATNICSYGGKKSGWRFRERFLFQTRCMTDGSPAFVPLFTHTFHQGKMLPFGTRLFLLPAFFVVVFKWCASLWGCHPTPRYAIKVARKSDTFITRQSIKCTAFLSELLRRKQDHL